MNNRIQWRIWTCKNIKLFKDQRDVGIKKMVKQVKITFKMRKLKKFINRRITIEQLIILKTINKYIIPISSTD